MVIPDGGVHIVGGENGDAFIAFATDEDARRAMQLTGKELHGKPVRLVHWHLSMDLAIDDDALLRWPYVDGFDSRDGHDDIDDDIVGDDTDCDVSDGRINGYDCIKDDDYINCVDYIGGDDWKII